MYRLLVSDFDQALLDSDEAIPLSTMIEIDRIRKLQVLFVVATGRINRSVLDYNRDFPFLDYVISCNGAYVYDVFKEKVLFKKNIGTSIIKKIKKFYLEQSICFCTSMDYYLCKKDVVTSEFLGTSQSFSSFYEKYKDDIYKIEVYFKTKKARDQAYDELDELKFKATYYKKKNVTYGYSIEITASAVHKKQALDKICKQEHISLSEVVAVGSSDTDISMVSASGVGVAVSNACKEVKKVAQMKTASNDTKGVEKIIKKLF